MKSFRQFFVFMEAARMCVCVCVCVFTSIYHEGFICLGLEFKGTDQRCCVEDVLSSAKSLHHYFSIKH